MYDLDIYVPCQNETCIIVWERNANGTYIKQGFQWYIVRNSAFFARLHKERGAPHDGHPVLRVLTGQFFNHLLLRLIQQSYKTQAKDTRWDTGNTLQQDPLPAMVATCTTGNVLVLQSSTMILNVKCQISRCRFRAPQLSDVVGGSPRSFSV